MRTLLAQSYERAEAIIKEHKDKLEVIAQRLLEKEVLSGPEMLELIGPRPHGEQPQFDYTGSS